jgi:hypothetical protein
MEFEAVILFLFPKASALYYKTKLAVHNFKLFNLANKFAKCHDWHEREGGLISVFATIIIDFLKSEIDMPVMSEM